MAATMVWLAGWNLRKDLCGDWHAEDMKRKFDDAQVMHLSSFTWPITDPQELRRLITLLPIDAIAACECSGALRHSEWEVNKIMCVSVDLQPLVDNQPT